ncbi:MAG: type VI secretion system baseplate subunit TssG [Janthinobacterium lividum]
MTGIEIAGTAAEPSEERQEQCLSRVAELLEKEPYRTEFFQAVRLLQRIEGERGAVGYFIAPNQEAVRFSSLPTLSFPPSQLHSLERGPDGQMRLVVQFMGSVAAISSLPHTYTEYLLGLLRDKDTGMADFLDVFNHRMISLFYRGWEKHRFFLGFEQGGRDTLSPRLRDLLGLGTEGLEERTVLPDRAYLAYTGLLGRHTRSAATLQQLLEDFFALPVRVEQFAGTWRRLPADDLTVFSDQPRASERLGMATVVGSEIWDQHGRIRLVLGPMPLPTYLSFLPGNAAYRDLESWMRFYTSGQYETEVQLILEREQAPACVLGLTGQERPRLGFVSWLKTRPLPRDPGDALFLLT